MDELTTNHLVYFVAGAAGAGLYLAALWWSVRQFVRRQSASVLVGGFVMRLGLLVALGLTAYATQAEPGEFLAGVAGFLATRAIALSQVPEAAGALGDIGRRS
jgi:F1F0 ATPase subunit 2